MEKVQWIIQNIKIVCKVLYWKIPVEWYPKVDNVLFIGLEWNSQLWASCEDLNDWFKQVLFTIGPTEGSYWWKTSWLSLQNEYNSQ